MDLRRVVGAFKIEFEFVPFERTEEDGFSPCLRWPAHSQAHDEHVSDDCSMRGRDIGDFDFLPREYIFAGQTSAWSHGAVLGA